MHTLRTPDDRFDLPGVAPAQLRRGPRRRRRLPPDGVRRDRDRRTGRSSCCCTASRAGPSSTGTSIDVLTAAGIRSVVPDLVGFGRSDKPTEQADHTYARHVEWVRALAFDVLDLRDVDAGRPGLGRPDRPAAGRRAPGPVRRGGRRQHRPADGRPADARGVVAVPRRGRAGRDARRRAAGAAGCVRPMDDAVRAAYDAPFPDESFKAGPRVMPTLVPTAPDDPATRRTEPPGTR